MPPRKADVVRVCGVLEDLKLGGNELVSLYRHPVLDTGSQTLSKGDDVAIVEQVRNDGKQQTEKNLSHKRSFASLKMTSTGHSEQREESHKLDCFARPADGGNEARNDGKEVFPRP